MSCDKFEKELSAHLDGELDTDARAKLEKHLKQCPGCARQLDEMRRIQALRPQLEPPQPSDGQWQECWEGLSRQIAGPAGAPMRRVRWLRRIGVGAGIAVAAIALFAAVLYHSAPAPQEPLPPQEESVCVHDYDDANYNLYIIDNPDYTIIRLIPVQDHEGG